MKSLIYHNRIVVKEILIADTFFGRFMGFMFRKTPHVEGIVFSPCNSIHTYFMNFSVDLLFINNHMEVIKKVEGLSPGRVIMPVHQAVMVIEGKRGIFGDIKEGEKVGLIS